MKVVGFKKNAVAFLILAAIVLAFWFPMYVERPDEYAIGNLDSFHGSLPWYEFMHDEYRRGNLPLWNPFQFAGQPFLGLHVPGLLYPPTMILTALLPAARVQEVSALMHLVIAGFFTYLFAGRVGLGFPARMAAAIGYMLSARSFMGSTSSSFSWPRRGFPRCFWRSTVS